MYTFVCGICVYICVCDIYVCVCACTGRWVEARCSSVNVPLFLVFFKAKVSHWTWRESLLWLDGQWAATVLLLQPCAGVTDTGVTVHPATPGLFTRVLRPRTQVLTLAQQKFIDWAISPDSGFLNLGTKCLCLKWKSIILKEYILQRSLYGQNTFFFLEHKW